MGDWEIDTIVAKQHQKVIVTLVERVNKFTLMCHVGSKRSEFVVNEMMKLLNLLKAYALTITANNGGEFAKQKAIIASLYADIYFARPYHSWG